MVLYVFQSIHRNKSSPIIIQITIHNLIMYIVNFLVDVKVYLIKIDRFILREIQNIRNCCFRFKCIANENK